MSRDLRLLSASLVLWGIGEGMFIYFQPLYLQSLGASPVQIGFILGLAAASMVLAHIPAGALADHLGRRGMMIASWVLGMLSATVMFLSRSLPAFAAGLVVYTMTAFVSAPMSSYITAGRGAWSVARALTTVTAGFSLGSVIGPPLGGVIAESAGLRVVYGVAALLFVASTGLVLFIRPQPCEPSGDDGRYRAMLTNTALGRFLALVFAVVVAMYLSWPLTPNFLQDVRGVPLGQIGLFGALNALGIVILNLSLGRLIPWVGFVIAEALVALSMALIWRGTGAIWYAAGYFLAGGFRTARSLITAQVEALVARAQMGLAFALGETVASAGTMAAAPLAGLLYAASPDRPFLVGLILTSIAIAITVRLAPRPRERAQPAASDLGYLGRE